MTFKTGVVEPRDLFKSTPDFATMEDMESYFYGNIIGKDLAKTAIGTGTSGAYNAIFGPILHFNVNVGRKVYASLRKKPYEKAGYRAISALPWSGGVGSAQGAAVATADVPTFNEITVGLKEQAGVWEQTARHAAIEGRDDIPTWTELRGAYAKMYDKKLNTALVAAVAGTVAANTSLESLDRIIMSKGETDIDTGLTNTWANVYGIDRTSAGYSDAYVNAAASAGNPPATRTLTLKLIDSLETNCRPYWEDDAGTDASYYTGYDTLYAWSQLLQPNQRMDTQRFESSVNGIKGVGGNAAGFTTQTYNGIPIIPNNDITARGTGGTPLRNVMLVDHNSTWIAVAKPVLYMESQEYLHVNAFVRRAGYYAIQETVCVNFPANGKLRDIAV